MGGRCLQGENVLKMITAFENFDFLDGENTIMGLVYFSAELSKCPRQIIANMRGP